FAYFTDETYKCGCSGQQDLILKQPRGGKIKHKAGSLITEPCAGVQQALQAERPGEITKFMVTVIFLNQRSMLSEGGNPFCVAGKDFRTANIKLHRDKLLNTWQNPG
ncbi:hypothetical protein BM280_25260, partial [Klebsiella michiganensis]